jgi:signal transduction histidine kinase
MLVDGAAIAAMIIAIGCGTLWLRAERRLRTQLRLADVIEQRRAQAALRVDQAQAAVAKLRLALDALPLAVWHRADDDRLIDCNREYARGLGTSRDAVLAEQRELVPGRLRASPVGPANDVAAKIHAIIGGQRRLLETREVRCPDGEVIGFAVDRTDVENAERELHRHIRAHAAVLEILSAAVAIFGPDKRLKFFNSAFSALWALDPSWLGSEPTIGEILQHLHESRRFPEYSDFRAFKRERCALFTSLIEPQHELMHLPDGRTLQLTISPHPFGGLIYVYDNVTDRLALECSYNTLSQVQRATLDHLFEGIAVYGGDGRLKLHNPAFRSLWGLSEADVASEPHIAEIVERARRLLDDGGDWGAKRDEMVAQVTSRSFASAPLYRRDGSVLQVASVPLPDGEVLVTFLDVSDTARIEQALRERNEALETAARLKSEFVAYLSHELRTPLNTVAGFAEILDNQYFGPLNSSQREYSGGILDSAHQLAALIDDITDLASLDANYLQLERSRVDVPVLLQTLVQLTGERARSRGLELELICPPQIGAIIGDERRLKQALFNLVSNAIKFTPPGGAVRISAQQDCGELQLSVCDTATDFATAEMTQLFDRTRDYRGRGRSNLGLSLVKSLIELHGGSVEIEAAPGRGTKVTCHLPAGRLDADRAGALFAAEPGSEPDDSPCEAAA